MTEQLSIEKWLRSIVTDHIQKEINNRRLATRAFVKEQIDNNKHKSKDDEGGYFYPFDNINHFKPFSKKAWDDYETEVLKNCFNEFLQTSSNSLNRTPASIKAKLFRILQESYQRV